MIWISFAFTLLRFILELPDFIEWLEKIFGKWRSIPEGRLRREAKLATSAMNEMIVSHKYAASGPCALEYYYNSLEKRYPSAEVKHEST